MVGQRRDEVGLSGGMMHFESLVSGAREERAHLVRHPSDLTPMDTGICLYNEYSCSII